MCISETFTKTPNIDQQTVENTFLKYDHSEDLVLYNSWEICRSLEFLISLSKIKKAGKFQIESIVAPNIVFK